MRNKKYYLSGLKCEDCKLAVQRYFYEDANVLKVKISKDLKVIDIKFKDPVVFKKLKNHFVSHFDGKYSISRYQNFASEYYYLSMILVLLLLGSYFGAKVFDMKLMTTYMGSYLIVFGLFKLIDLNGFVKSFRMYDPIAKKYNFFAVCYPFIEIILGTLYFSVDGLKLVNILILILFLSNSFGVLKALKSKNKIKCACTGTFFRLNLSFLTLVENFLMIGMSFYMLFL